VGTVVAPPQSPRGGIAIEQVVVVVVPGSDVAGGTHPAGRDTRDGTLLWKCSGWFEDAMNEIEASDVMNVDGVHVAPFPVNVWEAWNAAREASRVTVVSPSHWLVNVTVADHRDSDGLTHLTLTVADASVADAMPAPTATYPAVNAPVRSTADAIRRAFRGMVTVMAEPFQK
jgi:hypothetical protein